MAVVINAKGTSISTFQIGKQGPIVKNDSSVVAIRDKDDAADASLTADSISIGSPTGGDQGSGSINTETLYIDGTQLANNSATFDSEIFTGTGAQTDFTLSRTPISEDAILVAVSGLLQDGGVDYTVSGTTLTFTTAPPNTAKILVLFRDSFGIATLTRDDFTGTGSQTAFTLSEDPGNQNNLLVFIDGVTQFTPDAYTVSGTTLTFTSAPALNADIQTLQLNTGLSAITPGTSTVSYDTLDSNMQTIVIGKNVIINGNYDIWQRGTSFTSPANGTYGTDRFKWMTSGSGVVDMLQSSSVPDDTSDFSLQIDVTTADASIDSGDFYAIRYDVEGYDMLQFGFGSSSAQNLTLSFWVRSAKTGIHCVSFQNSAANRSYIVEYTINDADTWEYQTIAFIGDTTGTWLTSNDRGIRIHFILAAGSTLHGAADTWLAANDRATSNQVNVMATVTDNAFQLSRVQLELGNTATEFERRLFGDELLRCKRYFERFDFTTASQNIVTGFNNSDSQGLYIIQTVEKRVAPTGTSSAASTFNINDKTGGTTATSIAFGTLDVDQFILSIGVSGTPLTAGEGSRFQRTGGGTCFLALDAEL